MKTYNTQFDITNAVLDETAKDLGLTLTERAILIQVTRGLFKDEQTQTFVAKVSQGAIASFVGSKRTTVNSKLKKFEEMGILCSKQRYNTSKVYTWIALPTDIAKTARAKENRKVITELRSKLKDISKLTQVELLNLDRQIKVVDNCKGDRLFSIEDFEYFKLKGNFSHEIKGINKNIAKGVKDLLRQGVNINNGHEVQKLEDIEKCSGYVLYKASMTKKVTQPIENIAEHIPEPSCNELPPDSFYDNVDFEEADKDFDEDYYNDHHQNNPLLWASCVEDFDKGDPQ